MIMNHLFHIFQNIAKNTDRFIEFLSSRIHFLFGAAI